MTTMTDDLLDRDPIICDGCKQDVDETGITECCGRRMCSCSTFWEWHQGVLLCRECATPCYCRECDPDWWNDLEADR